MAAHPVAQVHRPGQAGRRAMGVVRQAGEEAAEPADHHAEAERADEDPAGRALDAAQSLVELDPDDGADQRAGHAVRQGRRVLAQRIERAGQPGAGNGPQGQKQEIAAVDPGRHRPDLVLEPPAIDGDRRDGPRAPGQQVEGQVRPGGRRDGDHGTKQPPSVAASQARRMRKRTPAAGGRPFVASGRTYALMKASRSGLMISGWVVHMPCGRPG